jgi:SAM-dependent methyltransferase
MSKDKALLEFTASNRVAWNESANEHRNARFPMLCEKFRNPDYLYLGDLEVAFFNQLNVKGMSVAQLACNNGRETLSIKRLGAARAVGFDISQAFIDQGHELAAIANVKCELVASDVYEIPHSYDKQFDLVFVSVGALMLMPDLKPFMGVAKRLLKKGGKIFLYERHPMLDMFDWDDKNDPPIMTSSYFETEPHVFEEVCNYWTKETYKCSPMYTFHHKLSDVFKALIGNDFNIEHFDEYEHDVSEMYVAFEKLRIKPALCYTLVATLNE